MPSWRILYRLLLAVFFLFGAEVWTSTFDVAGCAAAGLPAPAQAELRQAASAIPGTDDSSSPAARNPAATKDGKGASQASAPGARKGSPAAPRLFDGVPAGDDVFRVLVPRAVEEGSILAIRFERVLPGPLSVTWANSRISLEKPRSGGILLLPAPLESGKKPLTLSLRAGGRQLSIPVNVLPVRWPEQRLSVASNYVTPPPELLARIKQERARTREALAKLSSSPLGGSPFVRPVAGGVSSVFGGKRMFNGKPRSRHSGVDLRAAEGTPVFAAASGRVLLAEEQYFSGNVIWLDHGQGLATMYCHLSQIDVQPGDVIQSGQRIGLSGSTGRVTGPHLHFTVRLWGKLVNPLALILLPAPR